MILILKSLGQIIFAPQTRHNIGIEIKNAPRPNFSQDFNPLEISSPMLTASDCPKQFLADLRRNLSHLSGDEIRDFDEDVAKFLNGLFQLNQLGVAILELRQLLLSDSRLKSKTVGNMKI